ncbi:hypothetical protein ACFMPD_10165 [Sedimentitalea sp. HM32M-2]|uniref:hypothetical protein n=1 Tax=Sedimentitalea sp. HM32M-2 TaxID=3351566 RepID=UPI00364464B4
MQDLPLIDVLPQTETRVHRMIMIATLVFILASAIPFIPGAEIGFALLMLFGGKIAFLVYLAMCAALLLGFLLGRLVPLHRAARLFAALGFANTADLVIEMSRLDPDAGLRLLIAHMPRRLLPTLLRHRYLAIIALFNLPGNSLLGGGGGIAFIAGMSRLFSFPKYLASVLLAVAPFPLLATLADRF